MRLVFHLKWGGGGWVGVAHNDMIASFSAFLFR